jgi:hypothetical protein
VLEPERFEPATGRLCRPGGPALAADFDDDRVDRLERGSPALDELAAARRSSAEVALADFGWVST